jgi:hypothetical protein
MLVLKVTKINITFRMNDNIKHGVVMPNYCPRGRGLVQLEFATGFGWV